MNAHQLGGTARTAQQAVRSCFKGGSVCGRVGGLCDWTACECSGCTAQPAGLHGTAGWEFGSKGTASSSSIAPSLLRPDSSSHALQQPA